MKLRVLGATGLCCIAVAGCSPSLTRPTRANDPYGTLSASEVYLQKGVQYMEAGNYEVALQDLKRAIELDRRNSEAYNAIAVLYQRLEQPREADANFRKAVSANAENFGARNNYGRFLCTQGKYAEGLEQFQKVIDSRLYNLPWVALTNAGLCARAGGKRAEAEQYLRKALEYQPGFPPALLEMARLSREGGQYLSARAFLERFQGATDPTPESLWLGIEIETALGNSDTAAKYARTLLESFPETREALQAKRQFGFK
jgi:type IV pilus assembly protein PilF